MTEVDAASFIAVQGGFRGLINQGATCYLNSFVQTLFMTPELRLAFYQWEYDEKRDGKSTSCIVLQIQKLFARLQCSDGGAVSTKGLTDSFGWVGREVFQQHDVQEFVQKLYESIETAALGSALSSTLNQINNGSVLDYVHCQTCNTISKKEIPFLNLALEVRGVKTLENSLRAYTTPELLEGGNAYACKVCNSKQPALKGTVLKRCPRVLTIQLKRFDMNWDTGQRIKLRSALQFPPVLDLSSFVDGGGDHKYELFSVLLHTGTAMGGHYFCYTKDFSSNSWYQFNDTQVSKLSPAEVESIFDPEKAGMDISSSTTTSASAPDAPPPPDAPSAPDAPPPPSAPDAPPPPDAPPSPPSAPDAPPPPSAPDAPPSAPAFDAPAAPPSVPIRSAPTSKLFQSKGKSLADSLLSRRQANNHNRPPEDEEGRGVMADAYMLVYRRMEADNISRVENSEIPAALAQEVKAENVEWAVAKGEHTERAKLHVFFVHFGNPQSELMVPIAIPQTALLSDVLEAALKEPAFGFERRGISQLGQVRLRDYNGAKSRVLAEIPLSVLNKEAQTFPSQKELYIEERSDEGIVWPEYEPVRLRLQLAIVRESYCVVAECWQTLPCPFHTERSLSSTQNFTVDEEGTVQTLRQAVAALMGLPEEEVRMAMKLEEGNSTVVVELLPEQGPAKLADVRVISGTVIFAEQKSQERLISTLQASVHTVAVQYNKLGSEFLTEQDEIDEREPLSKLKEMIGRRFSLDVNSFKIRKDEGGPELKGLSKPLDFYNIRDLKSVYVEMGKPLREGEFICKVFLHDPPELREGPRAEEKDTVKAIMGVEGEMVEFVEADFVMLGHVTVEESWDLSTLTKAISALDKAPKDPDLIRVREGFNGILTRPYLPHLSLKQNCPGLSDFMPLYIQPLERPEQLNKDSRIVYVRQWYPQSFVLGARVEIALNGQITVEQLKSLLVMYLEQESSADQIRLVVPTPQQQDDVAAISGLAWHEHHLKPNMVLTQPPLRIRHGDTIIFKDANLKNVRNQTCAKPLSVAERAKLSNLRHASADIAWDGTARVGSSRGEVGLKIFTAQEQEVRALAREAENERTLLEQAKNVAALAFHLDGSQTQ